MARYLVLIHDDAAGAEDGAAWEPHLERLRSSGRLLGGSSLAPAAARRREGSAPATGSDVVGYLLIEAIDDADAAASIADNPAFVAGSTIDIHALVED